MTLWTAADAAAATGGKIASDWAASGVSIDTRTLVAGDLFVALTDQRDGHEFVAAALEKGAAAALVTHRPVGVSDDTRLLIVENVQTALEDLGRASRARSNAQITAITGSVGKTSTKEMLLDMLSDQGPTHASVASYNNHWGVPLTLARMPVDTEFAIIEIGMNHPGEIEPLAKLTRPHVVMITTVAAAHLEAFDNIEAIAVEKAAIIEGLEYGGTAVLNNDIDQAAILVAKAHDCKRRDIGFGVHGFDYVLDQVDVRGDTTVVQATANEAPLLFKLSTPGRHFAMNGLGALAVVDALGADVGRAAIALGRWKPFQGRGQRERIYLDPVEPDHAIDLIDDSYNANPTSMAAALEVLAASKPAKDAVRGINGRRIAFLGDMKELGIDDVALHAGLAHLEAMQSIHVIHCVGPLMKSLHALLPDHKRGLWAQTSTEILEQIPRKIHSGDVVLAKGSLSMKLGLVVDAIRKMGHPEPD